MVLKSLTFKIEKDGDEYHIWCPELKGCHTHGRTVSESVNNLREAVHLYIDTLFEDSELNLKQKNLQLQ